MRALRERNTPANPEQCADVVRACEEAAARMKSTSDELAACWSALRDEISAGVTGTELLRTRAWCNVLELRLKEHAHALEEARHGVDAVWRKMIRGADDRRTPQVPVAPESGPISESTSPFWAVLSGGVNSVRRTLRK
jgi:flagellar biosynthesis chaperone FliJ